MTVQMTSLRAYDSILPHKNTDCMEMLELYRKIGRPVSDREFEDLIGWRMSKINGRRNDLMNKKTIFGDPNPAIELKGKAKYNGVTVNHYGIVVGQLEF